MAANNVKFNMITESHHCLYEIHLKLPGNGSDSISVDIEFNVISIGDLSYKYAHNRTMMIIVKPKNVLKVNVNFIMFHLG